MLLIRIMDNVCTKIRLSDFKFDIQYLDIRWPTKRLTISFLVDKYSEQLRR